MAGGIWGDGQRGGIFGAKVDPRLQAELERRAAAQRQAMAEPSLADQWHGSLANRILSAPSKLFGGLVVDPAMDLATLAGDVIHGRQPTMAADPQTGEFHTDPRLADRAMNAAGMLTLGAGAVPAEANSLRMGIKAYHGSPHDFERFDSSKIGTGEGAQAYGHGIYAAENEAVAKAYKDAGPASRAQYDEINNRMSELARVMGSDAVPGKGRVFKSDVGRKAAEEYDALMKKRENLGHMYEVDIAADPEHFLDFDAPIEAQPPQAQDLLQSLHKYTVKQDGKQWLVLHPGGWVPNAAKNFYRSEEAATKAAEQLNQGRSVQDLVPRTPEQVAPFREAGIPGIRYLDQGSRVPNNNFTLISPKQGQIDEWTVINRQTGKHELFNDEAAARDYYEKQSAPTRNFVVFDDKLISILKKYGLPISAAGLAALSQLHPQEAQAAQQKGKR